MKRSMRVIFRVPLPLPQTRDNAAPCRGIFLPAHNPFVSGSTVAPGTLSTTTTSARGGGEGDAQKSEKFFPSLSGSYFPHHLNHVNANREETMDVLFPLLYDRYNNGFSRMDLVRIFIALGFDSGGRGGGRG